MVLFDSSVSRMGSITPTVLNLTPTTSWSLKVEGVKVVDDEIVDVFVIVGIRGSGRWLTAGVTGVIPTCHWLGDTESVICQCQDDCLDWVWPSPSWPATNTRDNVTNNTQLIRCRVLVTGSRGNFMKGLACIMSLKIEEFCLLMGNS